MATEAVKAIYAVKLIKYANMLKEIGVVSEGPNKGSISLRVDAQTILVSPSKMAYEELSPDSINVMDYQGEYTDKKAPLSRDSVFHAAIYRNRNDVGAVVHSHSPYATALAFAGLHVPLISLGMKYHLNGSIAIAPFAGPKDTRLSPVVVEYLGDKNALLLQNHGVISVGKDIETCYENAVFFEGLCESYVHALAIGKVAEVDGREEE